MNNEDLTLIADYIKRNLKPIEKIMATTECQKIVYQVILIVESLQQKEKEFFYQDDIEEYIEKNKEIFIAINKKIIIKKETNNKTLETSLYTLLKDRYSKAPNKYNQTKINSTIKEKFTKEICG
ncbi:hypothetical protein KJQ78_09040 [Campylobacter lari]|uniref:hypothetical protein n=1 Tax=Campylobacter lari TaxID=201 RepID=UPI001274BE18|nr:hypothetical protein [Campylobacter lari]MBT0825390.1 hypothetical protein [Campylobacter lari]